MKKIYFPPRKKSRTGMIIAFLLFFLLIGGIITFMGKGKAISLTGMAIYSNDALFDEAAPFCETCADETSVQMQGQLSQENTKEGLALRYGALKQEPVIIGVPVKWAQEMQVSNPGNEPVRHARIELEVPADAFNVNVFMFGAKLSEGRVLEIPYFAANGNVGMDVRFETSPIFIEIVEEKTDISFPEQVSVNAVMDFLKQANTRVKVWHNSSMRYYNVPVEMDIKLGERIVEFVEGAEQGVQFDYASGKARWVIGEI